MRLFVFIVHAVRGRGISFLPGVDVQGIRKLISKQRKGAMVKSIWGRMADTVYRYGIKFP